MLPPNPSSLHGIHITARYLLSNLELASTETAIHSRRICALSVRFGRMLGLTGEELNILRYGSLLHDVGKLDAPKEYLHKRGKLTKVETQIINMHPQHGSEIARMRQLPDSVADAILFHHERYDGAGYPYGLSGEGIPLAARIIAVVDAYDTIVHTRCYREAQPVHKALDEIVRCAGTQFDPNVAAQFVSLVEVIAARGVGGILAASN